MWLWCRLAATALIRPLAWEPLYAEGAAQEIATTTTKDKKTKKQTNKQKKNLLPSKAGTLVSSDAKEGAWTR